MACGVCQNQKKSKTKVGHCMMMNLKMNMPKKELRVHFFQLGHIILTNHNRMFTQGRTAFSSARTRMHTPELSAPSKWYNQHRNVRVVRAGGQSGSAVGLKHDERTYHWKKIEDRVPCRNHLVVTPIQIRLASDQDPVRLLGLLFRHDVAMVSNRRKNIYVKRHCHCTQ